MADIEDLNRLEILVGGDMAVDRFVESIEAGCKTENIDVARIDVLAALLRELERIAHELTGNGPDLLFSVAVDQLESHGEVTLAAAMRDRCRARRQGAPAGLRRRPLGNAAGPRLKSSFTRPSRQNTGWAKQRLGVPSPSRYWFAIIPRSHVKQGSIMKPAYTGTAKALHWLIVALLIAQFAPAWTMPHIGRNTPLTTVINLHFSFGC